MFRGWMVFLAGLMLAGVASAHRPIELRPGDPFEGTWNATLTPGGSDANLPGVRQFDEKLTFKGGKLSAKTMADKGFGPADISEDVRMVGPAKFICTQTSDKESKIDWNGTVTSNDMQGTMEWTKKDGTVVHYDVQGSRSDQ